MVQIEVSRWVSEGMLESCQEALRNLRRISCQHEGFIAGRLLQRADDRHHCAAVSLWRSVDDWKAWEASEQRRQLNACIAPMLDEPETVLVLEPL